MNVLLISQCDKRALTETRRILDQFAERRGDRTWQTPITQDGLDTLRRLLRKTARKNTAVACHWIRGLDHSELLWTVGDARRFNDQGAVPTNTTQRNVLRGQDQNDWHTGDDIHLLTALASLLHDLGKASQAFQWRLAGKLTERNNYRHEWVSLRLFEAFVGDDDDATWLARLAQPEPTDLPAWTDAGRLQRDGIDATPRPPFARLAHAPLAQAVGWLVVTHHRLPVKPCASDDDGGQPRWLGAKDPAASTADLKDVLIRIDAGWNETPHSSAEKDIAPYWHFPQGLPVTTAHWHKQAARLATRLLKLQGRPDRGPQHRWLANPFVMHLSRLALMLADHHYSSLQGADPDRTAVPPGYPLYANTTSAGAYNQTLDEHLIGVARIGAEVTHALPRFEAHLPHLGKHRVLRQRAQDARYRWQDKAAELASALRERSSRRGAFIVNMASTGCGKTLGNAKIMYALADPERGMRCAFAMGLRTLTLQTGRAFRSLLGLGDDELAIRVGGTASRELFEHYEAEAEATGSASRQALMDEAGSVEFIEGNEDAHPLLRRVMRDPDVRKLLAAPVLVCTIDHLTPATESQRGGRQIAPMLRLLSGDLVLDEPDDFDLADLPALTRLVHWAGLLGARVLLSSATLPPALVQGLFEAYAQGRRHFQHNRGEHPSAADAAPDVCCAWVDEFDQLQLDCASAQAFEQAHAQFAKQRHKRLTELAKACVRRRAERVPLKLPAGQTDAARATDVARVLMASAAALHQRHHRIDPRSGKRVSFGLLRMANIGPLVEVALALFRHGAPAGLRIHLCVYHSQFPLLLRSAIEHQLDTTLQRHDPDAVFKLAAIRHRLEAHDEADQLFVVLGSPVTEVGRDHDYDWAVVEPSSMRSLIQLAGRVRRHRPEACESANIHLLSTNLRHYSQPGRAAFCKPGYEQDHGPFHLVEHDLAQLLTPDEFAAIDARPRIVARPLADQRPQHRLVDLEHARTRAQMLPALGAAPTPDEIRRARGAVPPQRPLLNAATWWQLPAQDALLTAYLPQQQPFRDDGGRPEVDLVLLPNEDGDDYELAMLIEPKKRQRGARQLTATVNSLCHRVPDAEVQGLRIAPWAACDYPAELERLATELDIDPAACARRYGTLTLRDSENGWRFHPALGFVAWKG